MCSKPDLRQRVIDEARDWLDTPYVHCGMVKGPKGAVDCACLLIAIYRTVERVPPDFDPRPYDANWHLHQNEEIYMKWLREYATPTSAPQPGDVAMYRFGKHAAHGAILMPDNMLIHAHKQLGMVALCERRTMEPWFDSYWDPFVGGIA
jgi:cell wall-associated NlpC family hydrolase